MVLTTSEKSRVGQQCRLEQSRLQKITIPTKKSENNADDNNPYFNADSNNPDNLCKLRSFKKNKVGN